MTCTESSHPFLRWFCGTKWTKATHKIASIVITAVEGIQSTMSSTLPMARGTWRLEAEHWTRIGPPERQWRIFMERAGSEKDVEAEGRGFAEVTSPQIIIFLGEEQREKSSCCLDFLRDCKLWALGLPLSRTDFPDDEKGEDSSEKNCCKNDCFVTDVTSGYALWRSLSSSEISICHGDSYTQKRKKIWLAGGHRLSMPSSIFKHLGKKKYGTAWKTFLLLGPLRSLKSSRLP